METCFILEDLPEMMLRLQSILVRTYNPEKIISATTVSQAKELIEKPQEINLALIDLALPDGDGAEIIAWIKRQSPDTLCVVVTVFDDGDYLYEALRQGADGYLLKDVPDAELQQSLEGIQMGRPPLSSAMAIRLMDAFRQPKEEGISLTPKQKEVLRLIGAGKSTKQVAELLDVSYNTCCDHIKEIYRRLNIRCRAEAALAANRMGLVE
tara:strand:- start:8 stop:637 length:630 start_codon:yes stop_codon:yes gene_type:complete